MDVWWLELRKYYDNMVWLNTLGCSLPWGARETYWSAYSLIISFDSYVGDMTMQGSGERILQ